MKYLFGMENDFEEKLEKMMNELESDPRSEERVAEVAELFGIKEESDVEKITMLDIIPAMGELMIGIPADFWRKPLAKVTEEEWKLYDEAFDRAITTFTSNK